MQVVKRVLRPPIVKVCPVCGKEFIPDNHGGNTQRQKYCSRKCKSRAERMPRLNPNYEKRLAYDRKYKTEHQEGIRAKAGLYYFKNREKIKEAQLYYHSLLKEAGFDRHWDIRDKPAWYEAPEAPLNIESDLTLLTSDWHIPFHKPEYVETALGMALERGIPDIAVIGDFWDCDNYSTYINYGIKDTFQAEIKHITRQLKRLVGLFENVYFCVGNHEARFLRANAVENAHGHLKLKQMMNMTGITEGYVCTDNRWMTLNNEWRLTHPKNYSQTKLRVARRLADKYRMSVISTHGHFTAGAPDPLLRHPAFLRPALHLTGQKKKTGDETVVQVADIGGLFDESKMEYKNIIDTTFPPTNPGFAIYDHGEVTIIDLKNFMKMGEVPA